MRAAVALLIAAVVPTPGAASDSLVPELEQRLASGGVEAVNSHLVASASSALVPLNQRAAACELPAVSLTIRLSRSTNVKATLAHNEALRAAVGRCTAFVLALASPQEVPKFCASVASWTVGQTVRELRRRMAAIEADEILRTSQSGKSCRTAYLYELQNTRVILRSGPQQSRVGK